MSVRRFLTIGLLAGALLASSVPAVAQFVQQGPKLRGSDASGPGAVGGAVAIAADGDTAIVGGSGDTGNTQIPVGAAWIFTRSGRTWSQQGSKLVGTGMVGMGSSFGNDVALSADGNTALIGGWTDNSGAGAAWVFTRSGSTWTQQGSKLIPATPCPCGVGRSVALSADGNTAILGSLGAGVWMFARTGSTWTQQGALVGSGGVGATAQGFSVAVSADGNLAIMGGYIDNTGTGAVWTFARTGSTWAQVGGKITGESVANSGFGFQVALSADGTTAAVSSYYEVTGLTLGAVRIFTRTGSTWTQQGPKLVGTGGTRNAESLSLSADGNVLLEGASEDPLVVGPTSYPRGASWVFARSGGAWSQIGHKLQGRDTCCSSTVYEGGFVGLSSDGRTAIVGASGDPAAGSARVYTVDSDLLRAGDTDGDARSDIIVYNTTQGVWSSLTSASGYTGATNIGWGGTDYTPVPGDYDGDGKADLAVYQQSSGYWYVLLSGANFTTALSINAGGAGWLPVPGDYDGDGRTDLVVYNQTTGQWFGLKSGGNYTTSLSITYGGTDYQAVPGDFDGDGRTDIGVYDTATGMWSVLLSGRVSGSEYTTALVASAGGSGWMPVPADYDGDGRADIAVYNVTTGLWHVFESSTDYMTTLDVGWGGTGYAPIKGDLDGDGKADLALYVQSTGAWYILLSGANYTTTLVKNWGGQGYQAVPPYQ
jgi:hypothetical protein